jgi:farnesyl-diphosphate farnesyltransferase
MAAGHNTTTLAAAPSLTDLLRMSSRTFAVGIERLPSRLRQPVRIAYLLLRISDYVEDHEQLAAERKAELLSLWDRVLGDQARLETWREQIESDPSSSADAIVAHHTDRVLHALRRLPEEDRTVIVRHVRDSTRGMAHWAVRGPRIENEDDLDDYMHEVAGRVGHLLTELFAQHSRLIRRRAERLMVLGREFGLGLQTVNVIRGLRADLERGWIFIPESFVRPPAMQREALFDPENRPLAMAVVDQLVQKGARHLDAAAAYVRSIPQVHYSIRLFCLYPLLFAIRTLGISRGNPKVLTGEAKMSRTEVRRIVRAANFRGWSNGWIDATIVARSAV